MLCEASAALLLGQQTIICSWRAVALSVGFVVDDPGIRTGLAVSFVLIAPPPRTVSRVRADTKRSPRGRSGPVVAAGRSAGATLSALQKTIEPRGRVRIDRRQ